MNNLIVKKSNHLIQASYRLSISEQRVLLACIAQIPPKTDINKVHFEVSAFELAELLNIELNSAYQILRKAVDQLAERWVILDIPDPKKPHLKFKTRWISGIRYVDDAVIRLTFAYDILPYLSQLNNGYFTQYKLMNVSNLKSKYAIRIYELLMQWKNKGNREVELNWLKEQLQIEDEYLRIGNLKTKVIDPAIQQINKHSDIWVKYTQKKRGRKISHFVFTFGYKDDQEPKKSMALSEYCNIPKNHKRTAGKTDPELMKMMHADNILPKLNNPPKKKSQQGLKHVSEHLQFDNKNPPKEHKKRSEEERQNALKYLKDIKQNFGSKS